MASDGWGNDASGGGWGATSSSGWGAGGDAGGQPRSKGCFKCGEEGHNRANCPQTDGERKKGCFRCGEEGHNK